ncbi:gap junction alpha-9 protein-like [Denticeps clupeoides]|uniref:Gap junction protein n=1 Tax=Denticeps clupeoides TaxID=299321 RepID=A0AAY4DRS9_9TELE|nr:gap junction alpha-9 protein-like [Denticeps clupeoides]
MGDWNFLGGILEEVHIHSTMVGKIWLTILFIFRMLVLGVAAEDVWNDEQSDFVCNTEQPGCRNVCYDRAFPVSLVRYWVLQVIFVSSPSLVYMGHAIYQLRALEKERHCKRVALRCQLEAVDTELAEVRRRMERELRQLEQGKLNKAPLRGSLLRTYVAHVLARSLVEVGFMIGQYLLYGGDLAALFECEQEPCPNAVHCFVSRPTEKSVFMAFMQAIAAVSLVLSLLELLHLAYRKMQKGLLDYYPRLKSELDLYHVTKSKKNSMVHTVYLGATGGKPSIPTATHGYTLLLEKQGNGPTHPVLNATSSFIPVRTDPSREDAPESHRDSRNVAPSSDEHNSDNASKKTRSPLVDKKPKCVGLGRHALPVADSDLCPSVTVSAARKAGKVNAPWNCSTVMEDNASDSEGSGGLEPEMKTRSNISVSLGTAFYRADLRRPSRPQTPESSSETNSSLRHGHDCHNTSPTHRMSPARNTRSRRAPTDLQI